MRVTGDDLSALKRFILDKTEDNKDPKLVARGKLGGIKGGATRMGALTPDARRKLATDAANKRWGKIKKS